MILALDIRGPSMSALVAADDGAIAARLPHDRTAAGVDGPDPAAVCAFGRAHAIAAIGVASSHPHDRLPADLIERFATDFPEVQPARVISRGTAIALAEQWCGAATGARHVAALALDDSVHAGLVLDSRPFEGAHGYAATAAWMSLNPVDREDYRRLGGLAAEIGTVGIVKRLVWRIKAGDDSRVVEAVNGDLNAITVAHVFEHARSGDAVAASVVRDTARYIGMAIANVVTLVDPEVVVLGGMIAESADLLLDLSRSEAVRRLPAALAATLRVVPSALGEQSAPLGAVRAALLAS
jgi:glucokinase